MGKDKGALGHEFTAKQNEVIKGLYTAMMITAIGYFVTIIGNGINGQYISIFFNVYLGKLLWDAHKSMKAVVETEGDDIAHLMESMVHLNKFFKFAGILVIIAAVILGLVTLVIGGAMVALSK